MQNPFLQVWVDYMLKLSHVFPHVILLNVTYDNRCRGIEKVPCILVASVSREMLLLLTEVPFSVVDTPTKNTNMEGNKSWL